MTNLIPWQKFEEEYARMLLRKQGGARLTIEGGIGSINYSRKIRNK
jgi:hypothetical protein